MSRFELDRSINIQVRLVTIVALDDDAAEAFRASGHKIWLASVGEFVFRDNNFKGLKRTPSLPTGTIPAPTWRTA